MLSESTLRILEDLAQQSHVAFPEGGMIYTYTEAANQAHCKFPREFAKRHAAQLPTKEFARLALVLSRVLGNLICSEGDAEACALADRLWQSLKIDRAFTNIGVVDDHDDYCWSATIHMERRKDNRYFSLNLWASID